MALDNTNNKLNVDQSIINGPPQPTYLQGNKNLQPIITQFGTNTGSLHIQLLPNISAVNNNTNKQNNTKNNHNRNSNTKNPNKFSHIQTNDNEPLSNVVKKLKHKLSELVEYKYNFKETKTRKYFSLCNELHTIYTNEYCINNINPNRPLCEITILGQTLYLLSIYSLETDNIEQSHKYIINALIYWRFANKCALRMGTTIKSKTDSIATNFDPNDLGFFWPQIVECYIMCGNIFLKHFEYDVSNLMYNTALELCSFMESEYHFSCIDPLEYLMTQCIITHNISDAIIYCKKIIKIMCSNNNILIQNGYKFINTKALYSCLLRLSKNKENINNGCKLKQECIKDCTNRFGKSSGHLFNLYIYFIKHCIQQSAEYINQQLIFIEADQMIDYLSNVFTKQRQLKYFEEYWLCDLFKEYLFIISEQAIMKYGINATANSNNNNKEHDHVKRLKFLYPLHIKHIDNLNKNPLAKQYNKNCIINKIKIIACYADTFEAYQNTSKANKLRQQIAILQQR